MEEELGRLVREAQKGNTAAFSAIMNEHKEKLYRMAYSYFKNEQDALEAVQETAYRALKKIKQIKEPRYIGTWIVRILLNYCADEIKRKKRTIPLDHLAILQPEEDRSSRSTDNKILWLSN